MAEPSSDKSDKSWWTTLPGILTAIAAIITASGGLIAILAQTGQISRPGAPIQSASAAPTPEKSGEAQPREGAAAVATGDERKATGKSVAPASTTTKGIVITSRDGVEVVLEFGAYVAGENAFGLESGQWVRHDLIKSLDFGPDKEWDRSVTIVLVGGETLRGKVHPTVGGSVLGKNKLGGYNNPLGNIRRIEFRR